MVLLRLEEGGPIAWSNADGYHASQSEPYIDVDESETEYFTEDHPFVVDEQDSEEEVQDSVGKAQSVAEQVQDSVQNNDTSPEDILGGTLEEVTEELQGDLSDYDYESLVEYEESHADRKGAYNLLDDALR